MIRCEEVTKTFGNIRALDGCSFEMGEPSLTGVIGINGAGKTTLFKTLAGMIRPTEGKVQVLDEPAFQSIIVSQNTILIEEGMALYDQATLQELLDSFQRFYQNFDMKLAKGLMGHFQLDENQRYSHLSKGMASSFRLIIALASRAAITLLDEPANGMDPGVRKDFYDVILKEYIKVPRMMLIASHYLEEMEQILEHILVIHQGKALRHDEVEEFQRLLVALQAPPGVIRPLEEKLHVYEGKDYGPGMRQIIVNREAYQQLDLREEERESLKVNGISAQDCFIHLTRRTGGGIDELYHS